MVKKLLFGILIIMLLVPGCAQPPVETPVPELKLVGQVGGPTQAVAVQGNYAYLGVGLRLVLLDVSNPASLQEVGTTEPFESFVEGVAVVDDIAYVTCGGAGLSLLKVSNPTQPTLIGVYDTPGYAEGVLIAGEYAYVADGWAGLRVVDISDPAHPAEAGSVYTLGYAFDVAVAGDYAYVAGAGAGLQVVDISDPTHPKEVGSYDTQGYAHDVAVADNIAYIADEWEGLRIIDVSTPINPREIGFYATPGQAFGVAVAGSKVYVADAYAGLRVGDISNPAAPIEVGAYEVKGHAGQVAVAGSIAYVADRSWGLRAVDVSDPDHPTQVGFYSSLGYARDVAVAGNYAYVAAGYYGMRVVDVSDSSHPVQIGVYDTPGYAISVAVFGEYACLATMSPGLPGANGLHIVDVSDPVQPTRVGFCDVGGNPPRDMAVAEGIAYIPCERGLALVGLADPTNPTQLGFVELHELIWPARGGCAVGVAVSGGLAYVAVENAGLRVVDVSDPSSLKLVGVCEELFFARELAVTEGYAYVADHFQGLKIVDVSDPAHPAVVGSYDTLGEASSATVSGDTVFVCDAGGGLLVMDVSDPVNPTPAKSYNTRGYVHKVRIVGNYAYVADGNGGMVILETGSNNGIAQPTTRSEILGELGGKANQFTAQFALSLTTATFAPSYPTTPSHDATPSSYYVEEHRSEARLVAHHFDGTTGLAGSCASYSSGRTLTVTSAGNSGPGTLRWCLENAVSGDTIVFDRAIFPPDNPKTIIISGEKLPAITQGNIILDASNAGVILDGSNLTERQHSGLDVNSDGNVIKGLQILNFPGSGVNIWFGAKHNIIGGDRTRGSGPMGEGNLISGNGGNEFPGINISGADTKGNIVIGNFIGTDASGKEALGNRGAGVFILDGASYNRIGGTAPGERNIISANGMEGINIMGREVSGNSVIGNYVGTDVSGSVDLGNEGSGVQIACGAFNNLVKGNLISGNKRNGVSITDWGTSYNTVIGNLIGTNASGTVTIANKRSGVSVGIMGASFNRIGGTTAEERNVISGEAAAGISVGGPENVGNLVMGNYIGIDISGIRTTGNLSEGIAVGDNSEPVFIGGMTEGERNVISGNSYGVVLRGAGIDCNWVAGNYIGTDISGKLVLGNNQFGVWICDGAGYNAIQYNLISSNKQCGIHIDNARNNIVFHNNLVDNRQNGFDNVGTNLWDHNGEGNYWSDYKEKDENGDGIGDTPYQIPGGAGAKDSYPVMEPFGQ